MTCATNHTTNIKNLVNGEVRQVQKLYCLLVGVHSHDLSDKPLKTVSDYQGLSGKPLKTVSDYQGLSVKPLKTVSDYQGNLLPGNA